MCSLSVPKAESSIEVLCGSGVSPLTSVSLSRSASILQRAWLVCSKRKIAFKREAHLHDLSKGACATIDKVLPVYFEPRFIADKTMRRRNEDERA